VAADGGSRRRLLLLSPLFLLFPLLFVSVSLYILQFLTVIVWLLMEAAGGGRLGRVEGGRWFFFFYVFLALCFCSPVALTSAAPSSVSNDGGADVIEGAAGDEAE
jgi:hypothetical protein